VTATADAGGNQGAGTQKPADLTVAVKVVSTLAGGVGVLGFVALVGGSIVFARFSAAGLPADEALGDVPQSTLLVLGAKALVPFAVAVLVGATLLYVAESPATQFGSSISRRDRRWLFVGIAAGIAIALHVALALAVDAHPAWYTYVTVVGAAAVLFSLVAFGLADKQFQWFAIGLTIAGGLVGETSILVRAFAQPTVRPVAVALTGGRHPVVGIYIAESDTQVLVGEVCTEAAHPDDGNGAAGSMRVIPRSQIDAMAIGTNSTLPVAIRRGPGLLASLGGSVPIDYTRARSGVLCTAGFVATPVPVSSRSASLSPFGGPVVSSLPLLPHR
jgi:hypothetical protein